MKKLLVAGLIVASLFVFIEVFKAITNYTSIPRNHDITSSITSEVANGSDHIELSSVTNFEWDEAMLVYPYQTNEMVDEYLGFNTGLSTLDNYLIVFFLEDKPNQYVWLSRYFVDYKTDGNLTVENSRLLIDRME